MGQPGMTRVIFAMTQPMVVEYHDPHAWGASGTSVGRGNPQAGASSTGIPAERAATLIVLAKSASRASGLIQSSWP